jgi:hypothetical protein
MNWIKCHKCEAECAVGTSYCRQCGAPIDTESVATERFESRATDQGPLSQPNAEPAPASRRGIIIAAFVLGVITVIVVAAVLGLRGRGETTTNLVYPGATTVVDMTGDGGRALHLETSDSFSSVEAWYQKVLKPEKTMRLTTSSVVLKNAKTTATIASESGKTSILVKVAPK